MLYDFGSLFFKIKTTSNFHPKKSIPNKQIASF